LVKKYLLEVSFCAGALAVSENGKQKLNGAIYLGKSDCNTVDQILMPLFVVGVRQLIILRPATPEILFLGVKINASHLYLHFTNDYLCSGLHYLVLFMSVQAIYNGLQRDFANADYVITLAGVGCAQTCDWGVIIKQNNLKFFSFEVFDSLCIERDFIDFRHIELGVVAHSVGGINLVE
jgi:hypothetical protein